MANWTLTGCCNSDQVALCCVVGTYFIVILALWRTSILLPFKLITVFLHELGHATACKLTCGQVKGMEVNLDEGGVTHTIGGLKWVILPAGYLGSSFWGMVLIIMSANTISVKVATALLGVALLVVLFIAKNNFLRVLCICFVAFLVAIWVLEEKTPIKGLRYVVLFIGVMNCMFSVYDIYDDLISRRVNSSDAEKFAEVCCCPCNGRVWGVIWGLVSLLFLCLALYLSLVILD